MKHGSKETSDLKWRLAYLSLSKSIIPVSIILKGSSHVACLTMCHILSLQQFSCLWKKLDPGLYGTACEDRSIQIDLDGWSTLSLRHHVT